MKYFFLFLLILGIAGPFAYKKGYFDSIYNRFRPQAKYKLGDCIMYSHFKYSSNSYLSKIMYVGNSVYLLLNYMEMNGGRNLTYLVQVDDFNDVEEFSSKVKCPEAIYGTKEDERDLERLKQEIINSGD